MVKRIIGKFWRVLSPKTRAKLVRATQDAFTVSTAAIILNEKNEILLLNHVLRPYSNWGFPGGFVEYGEQVENAIRREVREEAGIELADLRLFEINTFDSHIEILWSAAALGEPKVSSSEIVGFDWFTADNAPSEMNTKQHRQIRDLLMQITSNRS